MAILLRVDVDKPFGHHTLWRKVISKVKEDYGFPDILRGTYLSHFKEFITHCNENGAKGHIYHRMCTLPDKESANLLLAGNHHYGLHAENTRSIETFKNELEVFKAKSKGLEVKSFSKHGSGVHKLGKNHYAPYEPEKYKQWATQLDILYPFGNGITEDAEGLLPVNGWYTNHFWMEHSYRHANFNTVKQFIDVARENDVAVVIHPSNYVTDKAVNADFKEMVKIAVNEGIEFKLINAG